MTTSATDPSDGDRARTALVVFGTRPEAIKVAPVVHALRGSGIEPIVAVTGQHREMLDQVLALFDIAPDVDLDLMRHGQGLHELTARAITAIEPIIDAHRPDLVVVQGDTTTTFAAAYAAYCLHVDVVHMEAGLRSGDRWLPFPEEMNRQLTTRLAALHLPPTASAKAHLLGEGVPERRIVVTGNTVIDALLHTAAARPPGSGVVAELLADPRRKLVVTAHRRESWGDGMTNVAGALLRIAHERPDLLIIFPIHRNPLVRAQFTRLADEPNVRLVEPLGYHDFVHLLAAAHVVLSDSGGVQEEAPSLGVPVLVMRETTERPEAVSAGCARLVGTDADRIVAEVGRLLDDARAHANMAHAINPYGDGAAARRTVAAMLHHLGLGPASDEFQAVSG